MFAAIVVSIALNALAILLSPKPKTPKVAPSKFDVPQPKIGEPVPVIFGEVLVKDAHIGYYGNERSYAIRRKGGKK